MEYDGRGSYRFEHEYDAAPSHLFPPAVKWLIIVNVGIYLIEALLGATSGRYLQTIFRPLELWPSDVFQRGCVWQLATYAFLHAGVMHILFNMLFLYWFGREIEIVWGTRRFLAFYFSAAVFAGLIFACVHYVFGPLAFGCIGASGAIMALVMVYGLWWPNRIILFMFIVPMRIRTFVLITIGIEILSLLEVQNGIANMAHLGGLLYGFLVIRGGPALTRVREKYQRLHRQDSAADQRRLDELLDKVHRKGINSLSWRERRFLRKFSARR